MWRKSSYSNGQAECVEVAFLGDGRVATRDSKENGRGAALVFTAGGWRAFKAGMQDGESQRRTYGATTKSSTTSAPWR
ncbi:DUF397 domain-containing protein [Streptomyces sp. NPDC004042]|uniref:DUF397 domain-containing protein n=1 Tax=Streptomyces sp. NPDC004042 TaxID=3154451 RepID=UPI0033A17B61